MPNLAGPNPDFPSIALSQAWHDRAKGLMTPPAQVLAKGPGQWMRGLAPTYLSRGRGSRVWDVDGNEYIDYSMAVGPVTLGHADPFVDNAIRRQLSEGIAFSLMHPLEVEVAELLRDLIPCAEAVRFGKTGAEATSAAVRIARAVTGRDRVVTCGYHGWHDWFIGTLPRHAGVPAAVRDLVSTFAYNDLDSLDGVLDGDVACVIMEPMTFEDPAPGFLDGVAARCRDAGAVLVFDEIWTGFRWSLGGAQELYGVTPDLATFSKGMANGMPVSAVVGRLDLMEVLERDAFFFSTFAGEALSLAAARATIETMWRFDVPARLSEIGEALRDGYRRLADEFDVAGVTDCVGHPARTMVTFDPAAGDPLVLKSLVQQEMIRHGILWQGFHTVSFAHTEEDIDITLGAFEQALRVLSTALALGDPASLLRGEPLEPVFRRPVGFDTKPGGRR